MPIVHTGEVRPFHASGDSLKCHYPYAGTRSEGFLVTINTFASIACGYHEARGRGSKRKSDQRASAGGAEEAETDDENGVPPKSVESTLNAVVEEETCAKWSATATAALTDLAHNEDDSAWSAALEAALEVARARDDVTSLVTCVPPFRDAVYNTQSCESRVLVTWSEWRGVFTSPRA
jgi:hypothetical protein